MSRRVGALWRHNALLIRRDPGTAIVLVLMPLAFMAFFQPLFRIALAEEGYTGASGAEQAVPGMAVMFALFGSGVVGLRILEEHGWGTWPRLRASGATPAEILVGKLLPPLVVLVLQSAVLFAAGGALFGLRIRGEGTALVLVAAALVLCMLALGTAAVSVCRTEEQVTVFTNLGSLVLAGLGGALVPVSTLPGWARAVAPATPSYWAMRGFRAVTLEGGDVAAVAGPVAALLLFAAGFALIAVARFRFADTKPAG